MHDKLMNGWFCFLTGGSDVDGTEYAGALSQRVFQTLAAAADDMQHVFGDDTPELSSLFVLWAVKVISRSTAAHTQSMHAFIRTGTACW